MQTAYINISSLGDTVKELLLKRKYKIPFWMFPFCTSAIINTSWCYNQYTTNRWYNCVLFVYLIEMYIHILLFFVLDPTVITK